MHDVQNLQSAVEEVHRWRGVRGELRVSQVAWSTKLTSMMTRADEVTLAAAPVPRSRRRNAFPFVRSKSTRAWLPFGELVLIC